jgi:hypothetical protein
MMSTKATIKYRDTTTNQNGYHLYYDLAEDDDIVFLEVENTRVELHANGKFAIATIGIPREMAQELGLVQEKKMVARTPITEPTAQQIDSACMAWQHDFGLLDESDKRMRRTEAREWFIIWQKEMGQPHLDRSFTGWSNDEIKEVEGG